MGKIKNQAEAQKEFNKLSSDEKFRLIIAEHLEDNEESLCSDPKQALEFLMAVPKLTQVNFINLFEKTIQETINPDNKQKLEKLFNVITAFLWQHDNFRARMLNSIAKQENVSTYWGSFLRFNNYFNKEVQIDANSRRNFSLTPHLILWNPENVNLQFLSYIESRGNLEYLAPQYNTNQFNETNLEGVVNNPDYVAAMKNILIASNPTPTFLHNVLYACYYDERLEKILLSEEFVQNPIIRAKLNFNLDEYVPQWITSMRNNIIPPSVFPGMYLILKHEPTKFLASVIRAIETTDQDDTLFINIMNACASVEDLISRTERAERRAFRDAIIQDEFFKSNAILEKMGRIYLREKETASASSATSTPVKSVTSPAEQPQAISAEAAPGGNDLEVMIRTSSAPQPTTPEKYQAKPIPSLPVTFAPNAFNKLWRDCPLFLEKAFCCGEELGLFSNKKEPGLFSLKKRTSSSYNLKYHDAIKTFEADSFSKEGVANLQSKAQKYSLAKRILYFFCTKRMFRALGLECPPNSKLIDDIEKHISTVKGRIFYNYKSVKTSTPEKASSNFTPVKVVVLDADATSNPLSPRGPILQFTVHPEAMNEAAAEESSPEVTPPDSPSGKNAVKNNNTGLMAADELELESRCLPCCVQ